MDKLRGRSTWVPSCLGQSCTLQGRRSRSSPSIWDSVLLEQKSELRKRLTYTTNRLQKLESEFGSTRSYLEVELRRAQEELQKVTLKLRRIQTNYLSLQRINQELEQKLNSLGKLYDEEKRALSHEIVALNNHLLDARLTIDKLLEDNELYRKDCNLAAQLLQCRETFDRVQKVSELPAEFQERLNLHLEKHGCSLPISQYRSGSVPLCVIAKVLEKPEPSNVSSPVSLSVSVSEASIRDLAFREGMPKSSLLPPYKEDTYCSDSALFCLEESRRRDRDRRPSVDLVMNNMNFLQGQNSAETAPPGEEDEEVGAAAAYAQAYREAYPEEFRRQAYQAEANQGKASRGKANRGKRGKAHRGKALQDEAYQGESFQPDAFQGQSFQADAFQGESFQDEATFRGESQLEAYRGESFQDEAAFRGESQLEAYRGESFQDEATFRGESFQPEAYRGKSFQDEAYRGKSFQAEAYRGKSFQDEAAFRGQSFQPEAYRGKSFQDEAAYRGKSFQPEAYRGKSFQDEAAYRGKSFQPEAYRGKSFQDEAAFRGKSFQPEAYRGKSFQDEAAYRGKSFQPEAYRGKSFQAEAYRGKSFQDEAYRGKSSQAEAYRGKSFQNEAYRGKSSQAEAYRGKSFQAEATFRGESFQDEAFPGFTTSLPTSSSYSSFSVTSEERERGEASTLTASQRAAYMSGCDQMFHRPPPPPPPTYQSSRPYARASGFLQTPVPPEYELETTFPSYQAEPFSQQAVPKTSSHLWGRRAKSPASRVPQGEARSAREQWRPVQMEDPGARAFPAPPKQPAPRSTSQRYFSRGSTANLAPSRSGPLYANYKAENVPPEDNFPEDNFPEEDFSQSRFLGASGCAKPMIAYVAAEDEGERPHGELSREASPEPDSLFGSRESFEPSSGEGSPEVHHEARRNPQAGLPRGRGTGLHRNNSLTRAQVYGTVLN